MPQDRIDRDAQANPKPAAAPAKPIPDRRAAPESETGPFTRAAMSGMPPEVLDPLDAIIAILKKA